MIVDNCSLNLLCCLACQGSLLIDVSGALEPDGHLMTGVLICVACGAKYPIIGGVPRFIPKDNIKEVSSTVDGFGYQWQKADSTIQNTRFTAAETFLDFIYPIKKEYFKGKIILDGGCGSGRFTFLANQFGAAKIFGVDLSDSVDVAFQNLRHLSNVYIIQADLLSLPLKQGFDYAFSIGVLHHTANPRQAFDSIVSRVKPGGGISAWVYGKENNWWIINLINPLRKNLTSHLPRSVLNGISLLITLPLFILLKIIYTPVGRYSQLAWLRKVLFYFDYFYFLSGATFGEMQLVVFDHLVPVIAEYISGENFSEWFQGNHLKNVCITTRYGVSWRGFGKRPGSMSEETL
jgi:SAM-dependent methyltransferase